MITSDQIQIVDPGKISYDVSYDISTKIYILKILCFRCAMENYGESFKMTPRYFWLHKFEILCNFLVESRILLN